MSTSATIENQRAPQDSLHSVVQPHGLSWSVCHPTETTTATQLRLGQYDVLGLYWHLETGYHRTGGRKVHATEKDVRAAIVRRNIQKRRAELELLEAELVRLNATDFSDSPGETFQQHEKHHEY